MEKSKVIEAGLQMVVGSSEDLPNNTERAINKKRISTKLKYVISHMTVEPILVFYILPSMMITIAVQNLNLEKACRVNLNISVEHCDAIANRNALAYPDYQRDEEQVQTLATYMTILKNIVGSVIPGLVLLFLGAWSDKFQKRKPCMLVPVLGDVLSVVGLLLCTYFYYEWPMEVNSLCESVFPAISGSWFAMFTGVYSYISDLSTEEERTIRIGAVNMLANVSMCIGTALSGIFYKLVGFYGVYTIALAMYSVSLIYGYFFIHDPSSNSSEDGGKIKSEGFIRDFFQTEHIIETLKTITRSGNKKGRKKRICAIMFLYVVIIGPVYGELNVVYFFVRLQYGWDSVEYSLFATFQFVTNILGTMFSLWFFSKFLKLDDSLLGIISCTTKIMASVVYAFASTPFYFYMGPIVEILNGTSFIAMRAMITKLVLPDELGKINSLFGIFEALVPLLYGPLYSRIYASTIEHFPGCFYIVGGALTIPAVFAFYWLYLEHKKDLEAEKTLNCEEMNPLNKTDGVSTQ